MKTLSFFVLDVIACFWLFIASFMASDLPTLIFGRPSPALAIAFAVGAQLLLMAVGFASLPKKGDYGIFRGWAVVMFMLAVVALPVNIYKFFYNLRHAGNPAALLDPDLVTTGLICGASGVGFLLIALRAWGKPTMTSGHGRERVGEKR